ncbi:hypothetical protein C475_00070 [Halosimplex carlsbadense 2-9-1]|uniref:Uncharacterized protein n=1 Tax=Halosimplex carlsbadense 2-9-1 TaxID=797114 RepID=M0D756_9EURY|nr:hypothetical protein [Halosimplex carlsbadense]ELZ30492.1 hypothetical protein C475_00070 [Halosimplex carlsbadense 2-9-1]
MSGTEITRRPGRHSLVVSGVAGATAAAMALTGGGTGAAVAALGTVALLAGVHRANHRAVDAGGLVAFLGVAAAALSEAPAAAVLFGTVTSVVAWDTGTNAVSLGRQLGAEADTVRAENLHAMVGAVVGLLTAVFGLVLFEIGPTRQPVTTLFVLLIAATLLVVALNR